MSVVFKRSESFEEFAKNELRKKRFFENPPKFDPMAIDDGICCAVRHDPPKPTVLQVSAGSYEVTGSRYPLVRLAVEVLKHRTWHWLRGEGFRD